MLSGVILVLAGAPLFGAGALGYEVCMAMGRYPDWPAGWCMLLGVVVGGILGFGTMIVAAYRRDDRSPPDPYLR
jgi:hypothetical protein